MRRREGGGFDAYLTLGEICGFFVSQQEKTPCSAGGGSIFRLKCTPVLE